jgi:DNA-binding transcriptional regulator YiaG
MSQMQLALQIGVSHARVRHWEKGQSQPADYEVAMLAEALGLTVQQLNGIVHRSRNSSGAERDP